MHRQRSQRRHVLPIAALLLAIVLAIFVRGRLLEFPLERDEGEFAYAGQLLLDGVSPYLTAYNMKFPGTYVAYAGLMVLFGQTTTGVHLGLLFINMITIVVIFLFARTLFDPLAAGAAAIAYALLSVSPGLLGMAAHATHFVALFAMLGAYALWSASRGRSRLLWLSAGCLFGIAVLMKQHALFLAFFAVAFSLAQVTGSRRKWRRNISDCALVTLGLCLPFFVTSLWLWGAGVFDKFWFWTVDYARSYASRISLSAGFAEFLFNGAIVARSTWPWGMVAIGGIVALAFVRDKRRLFLLSFLVASFLCVCPGFFFRPHYFIAFLPAVALHVGAACHGLILLVPHKQATGRKSAAEGPAVASATRQLSGSKGGMAAALALTLCATGISLALQADFFFRWTPRQACRMIYGTNPFVEAPIVADYLA
jgi:4-amino-4-deoxy-L-arabinose transferase-like glycosyltransferase